MPRPAAPPPLAVLVHNRCLPDDAVAGFIHFNTSYVSPSRASQVYIEPMHYLQNCLSWANSHTNCCLPYGFVCRCLEQSRLCLFSCRVCLVYNQITAEGGTLLCMPAAYWLLQNIYCCEGICITCFGLPWALLGQYLRCSGFTLLPDQALMLKPEHPLRCLCSWSCLPAMSCHYSSHSNPIGQNRTCAGHQPNPFHAQGCDVFRV